MPTDKMKIASVVMNAGPDGREWCAGSSEARYLIHWGMGLGYMGHQSDVINWRWGAPGPIYKNTIGRGPNHETRYDLGMYHGGLTTDAEHDKTLLVSCQSHSADEFIGLPGPKFLATSFEPARKMYKDMGLDTLLLPPLYPMPSVSEDFLPPTWNPGDRLKVLVRSSKNYSEPFGELIEDMKALDPEFVVIGNKNDVFPKGTRYIDTVPSMRFDVLSDLVHWCDIGISYALYYGCSLQYDFASLGKPLICRKVVKHQDDTARDYTLSDVLDDPTGYVETQQDRFETSRLKNWVPYMQAILDRYQE